ncbi:TolC family protein [Desulfopila sp. IMCC35006]|uniref:TolC family protein n=1 Tax=Desulfopila sp. IMCC35006 TaxID=2569542 RepID=UPI0010AD85F9|nr:TolC family protein [Desulfopila sp. IMCC35006]TKB25552.1 TolC family protein [Desulfopila sp. IMCC35006]
MKMSLRLERVLFLFVVFLCCASSGWAIDLAGMQKLALNNRQVISQYMTSLQQSEKDITLAQGGYYPSVNIGYTANSLNEATPLGEARENSVVAGSISWNIFSGFRDKYNVQSAEKQRQVAEYQLEGIRQDVQLNVALAYLTVSERWANRQVAETAFQTLEKVYRDGESRFQVGLIGRNDLLKFRVDYDNADITLKAADAGLKKSVNGLARQVGSEIKLADLDFADFKNLPSSVNKDEYLHKMLVARSEIKALESVIDANRARSTAAKSGYYPKLDVVGSYSNYSDNYINSSGSSKDEEYRAQLVLSMNLFQGFTTEASVARAKLATRSAQYELDELKNGLVTELNNLYIDFEVSLENVGVARRSIEQAEENLRITQLKYNEGLERESDLLAAITNLSRAKYNHVAALQTAFLNNFKLIRMVDGF